MKILFLLGAVLLAAGVAIAGRTADAAPEGETALAAALEGYEAAGPATTCVNSRFLDGNRSAGGAIIFEFSGRTLYVNRPRSACPTLGSSSALRIRTPSTRFCSGDIVDVFDPATGFEHGGCTLGDFTLYRRAK